MSTGVNGSDALLADKRFLKPPINLPLTSGSPGNRSDDPACSAVAGELSPSTTTTEDFRDRYNLLLELTAWLRSKLIPGFDQRGTGHIISGKERYGAIKATRTLLNGVTLPPSVKPSDIIQAVETAANWIHKGLWEEFQQYGLMLSTPINMTGNVPNTFLQGPSSDFFHSGQGPSHLKRVDEALPFPSYLVDRAQGDPPPAMNSEMRSLDIGLPGEAWHTTEKPQIGLHPSHVSYDSPQLKCDYRALELYSEHTPVAPQAVSTQYLGTGQIVGYDGFLAPEGDCVLDGRVPSGLSSLDREYSYPPQIFHQARHYQLEPQPDWTADNQPPQGNYLPWQDLQYQQSSSSQPPPGPPYGWTG
ncbi:hypothetical protein TREMEDRAFT_65899 [Tremella mesenterica DSM 1558]|uniref:uncharacterized protein n=1 Tax=Tremella mesenterica (strain ATCC 24925 / CBS 8224 / DSM 1558 / NBRC 9311 / NRRL Y-6157 / RJB 2259-6 / UBC 559-6) TaxID=578456 RepID=UPI00032CD856|nr:uncharacterized protein TREMEDRAFT_65899 [Tremella mesenterica DSM 1558]EIW66055.1 hypothetical protein TREMEDRAFT_65899 [Tremella mesenterica DSM 1558]